MQLTKTLPETAASPGSHAIQLFQQAKAAGESQVKDFLKTVELAVEQARWIIEGGDIYPAGVRDACEKLSEHIIAKSQSISALPSSDGFSRTAHAPAKAPTPPAPARAPALAPKAPAPEDDIFALHAAG